VQRLTLLHTPHSYNQKSSLREAIRLAQDDDNARAAAILRAVADALLVPVAKVTGLPPEAVQTFVEGSTVGSVNAGRAKGKKRKASAYNKAFADAYNRRRAKATKKDGTLRAGFDHKRLMDEAHKEARRMMKK
jgi:hypothetical protein